MVVNSNSFVLLARSFNAWRESVPMYLLEIGTLSHKSSTWWRSYWWRSPPTTHVPGLSYLSIQIMSGKGNTWVLQYQLWLGANGHICTSFQMTCPNSQDHDSEHDMWQVGVNITPNTHEFSGLHQQCHNHSHVYPLSIYMCQSSSTYICTYICMYIRTWPLGPEFFWPAPYLYWVMSLHGG